jgi:predicted nucleic acid-binding protein
MLVVDASCLFEVLVGTAAAPLVRERLREDTDQAAPHLIDVEVMGVVRRELMIGHLDETAAEQAIEDLRDWPGERFGHRGLLERAWELRTDLRTWDAVYVALAEGLDATLITMDRRLTGVKGLRCTVEVPGSF